VCGKPNADGWGTALKPAYEIIVMARKPIIGTVASNVAAHGTGGLNIDATRIETSDGYRENAVTQGLNSSRTAFNPMSQPRTFEPGSGRWPANLVLDEVAAAALDAETGELSSGGVPGRRNSDKFRTAYGAFRGQREEAKGRGPSSGGASRFFYTSKASRRERDAGLEGMPLSTNDFQRPTSGLSQGKNPLTGERSGVTMGPRSNHHPTVKPIDLMRWLCRLVTPPNGLILDPFMGSGSTGCAAALEGFRFVGIDRDPEYIEIATRRIAYWTAQYQPGLAL